MPPDQRTLDQLSLSREEYARIVDLLDREPNEVELGMFGALWSEHCGYKNSRPLLKLLPAEGPRVLTKAGEENAGVVDIGDGWGVAFKIESHNHPSAIEPYEGAATGVGGIVRDIFAMGARPVAILDSLRFGPLQPWRPLDGYSPSASAPPVPPQGDLRDRTTPEAAARNHYLFGGVVAGIAGYGNCLGIPTVGGEVSFSPAYSGNPLVNAMCVGVARIDQLVRARADGPGNLLLLVGSDTGRDGIHGATFASVELDDSSEERRPAVQVGNPFLEKLLMEACLELTEGHRDWIAGLQDLGAAGLTSSTVECAAKAGTGLIIDVAKVPRRESGMTPYEVMLSESQERMLVIVKPQHEADVRALFERWELHCATIGVVTGDGLIRVRDGETEVARVPAKLLVDAPTYVRDGVKPAWLTQLQEYDPSRITGAGATSNGAVPAGAPTGAASALLLDLLASPEIASKRIVWRQYDHQVGTNTVAGPGGDAAVIRIKGTQKAIAIATDGNAAYTFLDPYTGGGIAVCEAARNVACTGAKPIAMTNCLNFGNPEKPEVYFQLEQAIRGMADAARALGIPVISGNVSLYNESYGDAIWPTPVAGVVGLLEDATRAVPMAFQTPGDAVFAAGAASGPRDLAGSEHLRLTRGLVAGAPRIDLDAEARLQRFLVDAAGRGLLRSAHDVSAGGIAVALAECCIARDIGLDAALSAEAIALFGETQSRAVVSCVSVDAPALTELARTHGLPLERLGVTGGDSLRILAAGIDLPVAALRDAYERGLPRALEGVAANA
ncbi:MAG: phosphoribosylformylglycinamidine synthase subunit PurL [Dehalococcoidia bacterium]